MMVFETRKLNRDIASSNSMTGYWGQLSCPRLILFSVHEGVGEVSRRLKGFLNGARRHPADQVQVRTGLVVGTGSPCPTERLLTDHSTGRLVVNVEVPCGIFQLGHSQAHSFTLGGKHRTGQSVD